MHLLAHSPVEVTFPGAGLLLLSSVASGWFAARVARFLGVARSVARPGIHWTERARLFWPARYGGVLAAFLCAACSVGFAAALKSLDAPLPERLLGLGTFAGALFGGALAQRRLGEEILGQQLSRRYWLQGQTTYWIL